MRWRALTCCLWLISLYIKQHFIKVFIKKLCFFIFLCKSVTSSSVHRYRCIRRIDIDNLNVYIVVCFVYIFICTCINVILFTFQIVEFLLTILLARIILILRVDDLQLSQKGFWQIIELKFKDDPGWLDRSWSCCLCFSIGP